MNGTLERVRALVAAGDSRISKHAYQELVADDIKAAEVEQSLQSAEVIEDYPDYHSGPAILTLHWSEGRPFHAVWGLPRDTGRPAVLVTAYRPDPEKWETDWKRRKRR